MPIPVTCPAGPINIPSAWRGEEMAANSGRWLRQLSADEIAELERAALSFLAATKEIAEITKDNFPLPQFGVHLARLRETLMNGIGFEVIRGLPVAKYS